MAVTINSNPTYQIGNTALYDVTTSLVEDSSHVNLRIRASLYHDGVVKAVLEKPKGIPKFDFAEILKTLFVGCKKERGTGDAYEVGSVGSNLLSSWSSYSGTWTTLSTTGATVNSAICTVSSVIQSNTITMAVGELYVLTIPNLASTGTNRPRAYLSTGGAAEVELYANKSYLLMPTSAGSITIRVGNVASQNFSGNFDLRKITTDRTAIGQMVVPYFVRWDEVYEDSTGVTTIGAAATSRLFRYVPASSLLNIGNDYVMVAGSTKAFANLNFRAGAMKWYTGTPNEMRLTFFTEQVDVDLYQGKNGGALSSTATMFCPEGWGVVILDANSMASVTSQSQFRLNDGVAGTAISEVLTVLASTKCSSNRAILEYTGYTGGEECMAFEGDNSSSFDVVRTNYKDSRGVSRPVSAKGVGKHRLKTLFSDMYTSDYLTALLVAKDVKLLFPAGTSPLEVTVTSDSGQLHSTDLFNNEIEIEYDYGY